MKVHDPSVILNCRFVSLFLCVLFISLCVPNFPCHMGEPSPSEDDSRARERWPLRGYTESGSPTDKGWFSEDVVMAWEMLWRDMTSTTQTRDLSMAENQPRHSSKCQLLRCGSWWRSNLCWLWPDTLSVGKHSNGSLPEVLHTVWLEDQGHLCCTVNHLHSHWISYLSPSRECAQELNCFSIGCRIQNR